MSVTAVVPAAGRSERWGNYLGVPKQLATVGRPESTPLIVRTVRLLAEAGIERRVVVAHDPAIADAVSSLAQAEHPQSHRFLSETLLSTGSFWSDRTLVLLGDVFFTRNSIDAMVQAPPGLHFFGIDYNSPPHRRGRRPEIFAMAFDRSVHDEMNRALLLNSRLAALHEDGRLNWQAVRAHDDLRRQLLAGNFCPRPPKLLHALGMPRSLRWSRRRARCGSRPRHAWMYGKLYGLYLATADVDPFAGDRYEHWQPSGEQFHTLDDLTRDIDCPDDYRELMRELTEPTTATAETDHAVLPPPRVFASSDPVPAPR